MKSASATLLCLLSLALFGCDEGASSVEPGQLAGSGEPGSQPRPEEDPSTGVPTNAQGFNGGLTGKIVTTYDYLPYEFDLTTGAATQLPLVHSQEYFNQTPGGEYARKWNQFVANDSSPTRGFVETLPDCLYNPDASCLSVYDSSYQVISRVTLTDRNLESAAKLSPSGEYVVMVDRWLSMLEAASLIIMDVETSSINALEIVELQGDSRDYVASSPIVEWGLNDEVYYSIPSDNVPTVYVTKSGTLDIDRVITFPASYKGRINRFDIHPDGRQLLMEYRARSESSSIAIVLDLDTLELRIPAVNEVDLNNKPLNDEFVSRFVNPAWSPDGQYIMFLNTFYPGVGPLLIPGAVGVDQFVVAVPADSNRLVVSGWQTNAPATLAPAIIIQVQNPLDGQITSRWPVFNIAEYDYMEWVD